MGQQLPAGECLREGADWLPAAPSLGFIKESKGAEAGWGVGGREVSGLRPERLTITPYTSVLKTLMTVVKRIKGGTIY